MTGEVTIVTDSVASLPEELVKKYDIEVVPIEVIFGEKSYRDGIDITPSEFYDMLKEVEKPPTTAASLPGGRGGRPPGGRHNRESPACVGGPRPG